MAERVSTVRLSAKVAEYERGMLEAARATRAVGTEAEKLTQQREAFHQLGGAATGVGLAFTTVTALAVKAAIDWESAWAGVTKTVDGTPAQLQAVEDGLRDLTSVLPATHEEIAAVAEAAGQLGIETDNVVAFTRTMVDLGETTNLSADQAATALARFTNIMGTQQSQVSNLGSALVGLGNNYATTESEILEMSMRLAGAGRQIGLSEGEVLGLATSLSSVGIEAEAGGSAVSKVMIDIAASVEQGGERLDQFARVAGVSAEQFAEKWRTSPGEALALFVQGLANAESQGKSTLGMLAELGITEVRMRDALLRSAAAADMFGGAMAQGNKEFEANNALAEEAAKRYETVEARIQIAGNAIRDAAIDFGDVFLPAVGAAADGVAQFASFMGDLPDPVQGLIGVMTGAVGVITLVGGVALLAVPKVVEFKMALETLNVTGAGVRSGLGRFLSFLGGPWGIGMLAATAATLAFNAAIDAGVPSQEQITNAAQKSASALDMLRAASERGKMEQSIWGDYADQFEDLPGLLDRATEAGWRWAELTFNEQGAIDSIKRLGDSLGEMAQTNLPAAQDAFSKLVNEFDLTEEQASALLNEMPALRDELLRLATANGVVADDAYLLNLAMGEGEETTQSAADAYKEAADQANALTDEVLGLLDAINAANGVGQDAVSTNARYQEALAGISAEVQRQKDEYEELNGTLDGFKLTLDQGTASGAANAAMLADVAGAAQASAAAQFEQDKATMSAKDAADKYYETLSAQRQAFIDSATAAGFNKDEVQALADQVFRLPSEKEMDVVVETADAESRLNNVARDRTARIRVVTDASQVPSYVLGGPFASADGNLIDHHNRMVQAFANGGFPTGIYAGRPGGIHKFAEPETLWEAYISGKPDQRDRNVSIWMETGQRLGAIEKLIAAVRSRGSGGPSREVNFNGPITAYDPSEVVREMDKLERQELALSGLMEVD